jgi:hypothetical protein
MIRGFLWSLVGAMTLQGILHADEYGSAATLIGGMSLTMTAWKEGAQSWMWLSPRIVYLPRAIVQSALRETALHPGIHAVPRLQSILKTHQRVWDAFREEELKWLLGHADLIGAILNEPVARELWTHWRSLLNYSETALAKARAETCIVRAMSPSRCDRVEYDVRRYMDHATEAAEAVKQWELVLSLNRWLSVREWWSATQKRKTAVFHNLSVTLAGLHDIDRTTDPRLRQILVEIPTIAATLCTGPNPWLRRLLSSLLTGEIWSACLAHVRAREGRVRELMVVAGVQDLINAHDRILNASLRAVLTADERRKVQDWFGEMNGRGWWMADDIPNLVRRCIGQEGGDCMRIGPAEIIALTERFAERSRIVTDWTRRILIGMWNAIPVIGILFVVEIVLLCLMVRPVRRGLIQQGQQMMLE